jgi:hypothetical protein
MKTATPKKAYSSARVDLVEQNLELARRRARDAQNAVATLELVLATAKVEERARVRATSIDAWLVQYARGLEDAVQKKFLAELRRLDPKTGAALEAALAEISTKETM